MSVFQVKLDSIQRTLYVAGPDMVTREFKDGDTFTDCNYWKRFAYPQLPLEEAFIKVISDDGSIYSDVKEENNFARVYTIIVDDETDYEDNIIDIYEDNGAAAQFVQIHNSGDGDIKIRINSSTNAILDLASGSTQSFNQGELSVTMLEFKNQSGTNTTVQVLVSIKSCYKL
jgi:hypothetical protein